MAVKVKKRRREGGSKRSAWWALPAVVGALAGLVLLGILTRWLAVTVAPWLYLAADGDHARLVAILVAMWALLPLGGFGVSKVFARYGRVAGWAAVLALAPLALCLLGTVPGRNNDGRLSQSLNEAVGGGLADTGEVFVAVAMAGLLGNLVVVVVSTSLLVPRATTSRWVLTAGVVVAGWVGVGLLVTSIVGDTEPRGAWLDQTAERLAGGDEGITGRFQVGLEPTVDEVVDCDTAAAALRVDGDVPELPGCRKALLVSATGRYGEGAQRSSSGALVAVVLQVRTDGQLGRLDEALDGVELVEAAGLPAPPGTTLATKASRALSLVVAAEDTGGLPLPSEGAGRRPLTRSLAYVVTGSAVGFYLAPPEEPATSGR